MTCSRRCLCYLPALKHGSKHSTKFHLTKFKNVEMDWATQCFWWLSAVPHRTLNSMLFSASRTLWAAACAKAWTDCTGFSNSRVHQTCMSRTLCSVVVFFFLRVYVISLVIRIKTCIQKCHTIYIGSQSFSQTVDVTNKINLESMR